MKKTSKQNKKTQRSITSVYLFVEGEKTETAYFDLLKNKLSISGLTVYLTRGKSGHSLLDEAKSKIKGDNLDEDAIKYLVFDKDTLTKEQFSHIFDRAAREGFKIGFSNLNIEVWLLAHFEKLTNRPTSLSDKKPLEGKLTKYLNQKYKKGCRKQLEKMISNYEQAVANADEVSEAKVDYQCTTVGSMIEEIRGSCKK